MKIDTPQQAGVGAHRPRQSAEKKTSAFTHNFCGRLSQISWL